MNSDIISDRDAGEIAEKLRVYGPHEVNRGDTFRYILWLQAKLAEALENAAAFIELRRMADADPLAYNVRAGIVQALETVRARKGA